MTGLQEHECCLMTAIHDDAGQDPDSMDRSEFSQITPWPSPDTYSMIIKAAHDGAQALVDSPQGHLLRCDHLSPKVHDDKSRH